MKQDILNYIKTPPFEFEYCPISEEVELKQNYNYKGWYISVNSVPKNKELKVVIWNEKLGEYLGLTDGELDDILTVIENELTEWETSQQYLQDQLNHESDLWENRFL